MQSYNYVPVMHIAVSLSFDLPRDLQTQWHIYGGPSGACAH